MENANLENLKRQFERIGARLEVQQREATRSSRRGSTQWFAVQPFSANVRTDRRGEHFTVTVGDNSAVPDARSDAHLTQVRVLDCQPADRHLLLQVVLGEGRDKQVDHLLMGHDERHWFIAQASGRATTVAAAKELLKPEAVQSAQRGLKRSQRKRRRNSASKRQGEWFFLPATELELPKHAVIFRNEPLVRAGGGKPHIAEELWRRGGETVWVHPVRASSGISEAQYRRLMRNKTESPDGWRAMTRNAQVFVRGTVRHPDHATLKLQGWHAVIPNTEQRRVGRRLQTMAFLD